jgi:hypothetical protein
VLRAAGAAACTQGVELSKIWHEPQQVSNVRPRRNRTLSLRSQWSCLVGKRTINTCTVNIRTSCAYLHNTLLKSVLSNSYLGIGIFVNKVHPCCTVLKHRNLALVHSSEFWRRNVIVQFWAFRVVFFVIYKFYLPYSIWFLCVFSDVAEFESSFQFACPKFLSPVPPTYDVALAANYHKVGYTFKI